MQLQIFAVGVRLCVCGLTVSAFVRLVVHLGAQHHLTETDMRNASLHYDVVTRIIPGYMYMYKVVRGCNCNKYRAVETFSEVHVSRFVAGCTIDSLILYDIKSVDRHLSGQAKRWVTGQQYQGSSIESGMFM